MSRNQSRSKGRKKKKTSNAKLTKVSKICISLSAFIIAIFLFLLLTLVVTLSYDRVYGGIYLNEVSVSHMSREELRNYIDERYNRPLDDIVIEIYSSELDDKQWTLNVSDLDMSFDRDAIVDAIFNYGHDGNIFRRLSQINTLSSNRRFINLWDADEFNGIRLVTYNEEVVSELAAQIAEEGSFNPTQNSYEIDDENGSVAITAGKAGQSFDAYNVKVAILRAVNGFESTTFNISDPELDLFTPIYPNVIDAEALISEVDRAPVNARLGLSEDRKEIQHRRGTYGISINRASLEEVLAKLTTHPGQTFNVEVTRVRPEITTVDLPNPTFNDMLGQYTTTFGTSGAQSNRNHNLQLATNRYLNNIIVLPGETFSFNGIVGGTTTAQGFRTAPGFVDGGTEPMPGGGICQVASTLYNAVIRSAGLRIVERRSHSQTVDYVPRGMDAMIFFPARLDFRFSNNLNHPVRIIGVYEARGRLTFRIMGVMESENNGISYRFIQTRVSTTPYRTETVTDSSRVQTGRNAEVWTVTRVTYRNGVEINREANWSRSSYRGRPRRQLRTPEPSPSPSPTTPTTTAPGTTTPPPPTTPAPTPPPPPAP